MTFSQLHYTFTLLLSFLNLFLIYPLLLPPIPRLFLIYPALFFILSPTCSKRIKLFLFDLMNKISLCQIGKFMLTSYKKRYISSTWASLLEQLANCSLPQQTVLIMVLFAGGYNVALPCPPFYPTKFHSKLFGW